MRDENGELLYKHTTVDHSKKFVKLEDNTCTNRVESRCNTAKARNLARCCTNRSTINSYRFKYMWHERNRETRLFEAIMRDIAIHRSLE